MFTLTLFAIMIAGGLYPLVLDVRADGFDPASVDRERLGAPSKKPSPPEKPSKSDQRL